MNSLSFEINQLCKTKNMLVIDAIVQLSKDKDLEIELLAETIKQDPLMISKIRIEAENLNILKRGARLPI